MDAGLAALVGAALGAVASLGAASVSGRAQARSQHDQWRRQVRREAYTQYLVALHDRDVAMDDVLRALDAEAPDQAVVDGRVETFIGLAREVHRAAEVVLLEGPSGVGEAVSGVAEASSALSGVMRRMVDDARRGDASRRAEDLALAVERSDALWEAVKAFRAVAGGVLGDGG
ncbi:proline dehydrogenase [Streptomyces sp. Rer75]|uniref:proline dehydrogenase n=1 Tax=unclassified Streptomyces TaxID=2593676 RepID=UPI0015D07C77|nr:proline dehydrogenase [Streptomyces sp. Rer75]QLH23645.1 proline dehydrogenase [Streptomyces sp. Rer75]